MQYIINILHWTVKWWYPSVNYSNHIVDWWILQVKLWYSTRGFLWTISHIKAIRLHITRFICGDPLLTPQGSFALDRRGLPKGLKPLTDSLTTNKGKSFVLTLLNISRCLPGTKEPDLSTITNPWTGHISNELEEFIPQFIKMYNFPKYCKSFTLHDLYNSNKSGPVGQATQTSVMQADLAITLLGDDLSTISQDIIKPFVINGRTIHPEANIMKPLNRWSLLVDSFRHIMKDMFKAKSDLKYLRKLSIIKDPEAKARIICVFDYWSQVVLKKVHFWAFDLLRLIPQDRTFDQDVFAIKQNIGPYYSIDLSAATDRFPVKLQTMLLSALSDPSTALSWERVLTKHDVYVPWTKSTVKYAVGQPMGAYSSWAIFALTHHLVVQYSANMEGYTSRFEDYMLLGDDIVIASEAVAKRYIATMSELGVEISFFKSHKSLNTYEFAKRWIHNGVEISGIPLRGIISSLGKYHLLAPLLYTLIRRVRTAIAVNVPDLLYDLNIRSGVPIRQSRSYRNRTVEFLAVWKYVKEGITDDILSVIKLRDDQWHPFPDASSADAKEYLDWLLERTMIRESMQVNEDVKSLSVRMADRWTKLLNSLVNQQEAKYEIEAAMPYHPSYQSLQAEAYDIAETVNSILESKDYRALLKVMLPDPDSLMVDRSNVKLAQSVAKFSKNVFKTAAMQRKKDIWFLSAFD
jgi:hypothetical protein